MAKAKVNDSFDDALDQTASVLREILDREIEKKEAEKEQVREKLVQAEIKRMSKLVARKKRFKLPKLNIDWEGVYCDSLFILIAFVLLAIIIAGVIDIHHKKEETKVHNQVVQESDMIIRSTSDDMWTTNKFISREVWDKEFPKFVERHKIDNLILDTKKVTEKEVYEDTNMYNVVVSDSFCGCGSIEGDDIDVIYAYIFVKTTKEN